MIPNTTTRRTKAKNIIVFLYKQANKMVLGSAFFSGTKDILFPDSKKSFGVSRCLCKKTETESDNIVGGGRSLRIIYWGCIY